MSIDVVTVERRWQVRFDGSAPAAPTEVTLPDRTEAHTRPLTYESGHRAVLPARSAGRSTASPDTLAVTGRLLGVSVVNRKEHVPDRSLGHPLANGKPAA